jgi:DNA-binding NarL/FixJ family response regulator
MVAGKTNKQIAAQLGLSVRTIFMNQHNLRERLQAATNVEMVYLACLLGILETDLTKQTLQN